MSAHNAGVTTRRGSIANGATGVNQRLAAGELRDDIPLAPSSMVARTRAGRALEPGAVVTQAHNDNADG